MRGMISNYARHLVAEEVRNLEMQAIERLTVLGHRNRLCEQEAILALESGDLSTWKLGEEVRLLVVLHVRELGQVELNGAVGRDGTRLLQIRSDFLHLRAESHTYALNKGVARRAIEGADRSHGEDERARRKRKVKSGKQISGANAGPGQICKIIPMPPRTCDNNKDT
jgi:hypothetical protein